MAQTLIKTYTVQELSKFGFKADGKYINYSKNLKESDKVHVVPGRTLQLEIYVADSSKEYVNKVLNAVESADVPAPAPKKSVVTVKPMSKAVSEALDKADKPMTREDWDSKDKRISRQGVIQAAVQAVASFSTQEDLYSNAEALALKMLDFVNEK